MDNFLAAQACDPFDPAPLLIQADWLEEQGDLAGAMALRGFAASGMPSIASVAILATGVSSQSFPDGYTLQYAQGDGTGDGSTTGGSGGRGSGSGEGDGDQLDDEARDLDDPEPLADPLIVLDQFEFERVPVVDASRAHADGSGTGAGSHDRLTWGDGDEHARGSG